MPQAPEGRLWSRGGPRQGGDGARDGGAPTDGRGGTAPLGTAARAGGEREASGAEPGAPTAAVCPALPAAPLPRFAFAAPKAAEKAPGHDSELVHHENDPPAGNDDFQFAELPPGARRGQRGRVPPGKLSRGRPSQFSASSSSSLYPEAQSEVHILDRDWSDCYEKCPTFGELWREVQAREPDWPEGHKMFRHKLYHLERLCVPEALVAPVVRAHHEWLGHMGLKRSLLEIDRRFEFPEGTDIKSVTSEIKKNCLICQACDRPNWPSKGPISMTPIPDRFMASVCLDVFSMPIASWQGCHYDAFLLCVDRHSGWVVAKPTQKFGLSGEKAAHLMLDSTWGELGVPSVITSDQGPQFVSQWWQTMCGRLGIRCAFSQAHRPQANGRAEVAGRVLQDVLRKLLIDSDINWVEALPRALRILHDTPEPISGLSPYEIVFGRERALAGLPWSSARECPEAHVFFDEMRRIDQQVAAALNATHEALAEKINSRRRERPPYEVGEWVWYLRPKSVGGAKLHSWWQGPFKVLTRAGRSSYRLRTPQGQEFDAHSDQLKPCSWTEPEDPITSLQYPPVRDAVELDDE